MAQQHKIHKPFFRFVRDMPARATGHRHRTTHGFDHIWLLVMYADVISYGSVAKKNALKHAATKHGLRGVHPEPGPVFSRRHRHDQSAFA